MSNILKATEQKLGVLEKVAQSGDRRTFLKFAGMSVAILTVAGCSDTTTSPTTGGTTLTNDDFGVLNYAYALEQLEAAFYTQVIGSFPAAFSTAERAIFMDIQAHEVSHRDFFKAALGTHAIGSLEPNFSSIDFTSRDNVLATARTFEDLGVSAYNGAGQLLTTPDYLVIAGKIVSVEARHASTIRDLINPKSTAFSDDMITPGGLDLARKPSEVLAAAGAYIKTTITSNLP
ncbi:MAG: ferritin-like domain-containing protein [Candidatus Kapaibacterium sp.]